MNKVLTVITSLGAMLCLLLCSCGEEAPDAVSTYNPTATAEALLASKAFSGALEEIDKEMIPDYYGLDGSTIQEAVAYGSLSAGAEELVVLTLNDEQGAKAAVEALNKRVESQKQALKDYQPQEVAKLDGAIIDQRGNSALLVVAADADAAQTVLNGLDQ